MAITLDILIARVEILEKQMTELNIAKPDSKPKRTSGYLMHNTARRAEVKARLDAEGAEKIKATDVTKELAIIWKALSDSEREEWNKKAKSSNESPEWLNEAAINLRLEFPPPAPPAPPDLNDGDIELEAEEIDIEVEVEKPKKSKKEKKAKDDKPKKKRISGYILFQKAMRDDVLHLLKDDLQEADAKIKQSDVMSKLGKMWKELDDDDRDAWNEKAAEQKTSDNED